MLHDQLARNLGGTAGERYFALQQAIKSVSDGERALDVLLDNQNADAAALDAAE